MSGFIKLHRKIQEHWIYQEKRKFSRYEAWLDMLMMANHRKNKFLHGSELVEVEKGQFVTSEVKLMERWDWGKNKLRLFFDLLEKDGMVIKKSDRKRTTITICNYGLYHTFETTDGPQTDCERTDNGLITDTNKNEENVENEKNDKKVKPLSRNKTYSEDSVEYKMALYLHTKIMEHANESGVAHLVEKANLQKWADDCRKLLEIDKVDKALIKDVIDWTTSHSFWKSNILSASKLREKFQDLAIKMNSTKPKQEDRLDFINDL